MSVCSMCENHYSGAAGFCEDCVRTLRTELAEAQKRIGELESAERTLAALTGDACVEAAANARVLPGSSRKQCAHVALQAARAKAEDLAEKC